MILLQASDEGLLRLQILAGKEAVAQTGLPSGTACVSSLLLVAQRQLEEYFERRRQTFDLPLLPEGTPFQQRVWKALCNVPYGTTLSYTTLAELAGNPRAQRATGSANGRNPLPIFIPCHRIIRSDGSLGGYAYGLPIKRFLLNLEASR
ncbi:MAG: methylated-DNA--[protein]-cysteine S-methyltransferase [Tannerellaceae bacterium]|nr:methylated-DNA--[protein]-cysteine S-methyltransferase [Tannerellaceae bacterium]